MKKPESKLLETIRKRYGKEAIIIKLWQGIMSSCGLPDIIFIKGKIFFIELKVWPKQPTKIQWLKINTINKFINPNCGEAFWITDKNWKEELEKRIGE